jgi:hypothetical protein
MNRPLSRMFPRCLVRAARVVALRGEATRWVITEI